MSLSPSLVFVFVFFVVHMHKLHDLLSMSFLLFCMFLYILYLFFNCICYWMYLCRYVAIFSSFWPCYQSKSCPLFESQTTLPYIYSKSITQTNTKYQKLKVQNSYSNDLLYLAYVRFSWSHKAYFWLWKTYVHTNHSSKIIPSIPSKDHLRDSWM